MPMRMQELAERTGLPRTTIHHYAREGLLPPSHKTAPNAAEYDARHIERLTLITRLRGSDGDGGSLSIPEIRTVLEHVDAGADLRVAVRLVKAGVAADPAPDGSWSTASELANAAGLEEGFIATLVDADLVGRGRDGAFTSAELLVARACHTVCASRAIDPADLTPLCDLIREVGNYSATLAEVHIARAPEPAGDPAPLEGCRTLETDVAALCDVLLWRVMQA